MAQQALADNGPLAGRQDLTVELVDGEFPRTWVWTTGPDELHEYGLKTNERALTSRMTFPIYVYVRTLPADD